jgi:hypothetical protein
MLATVSVGFGLGLGALRLPATDPVTKDEDERSKVNSAELKFTAVSKFILCLGIS